MVASFPAFSIWTTLSPSAARRYPTREDPERLSLCCRYGTKIPDCYWSWEQDWKERATANTQRWGNCQRATTGGTISVWENNNYSLSMSSKVSCIEAFVCKTQLLWHSVTLSLTCVSLGCCTCVWYFFHGINFWVLPSSDNTVSEEFSLTLPAEVLEGSGRATFSVIGEIDFSCSWVPSGKSWHLMMHQPSSSWHKL